MRRLTAVLGVIVFGAAPALAAYGARTIWDSKDGLDPFELFGFLLFDHPAATLAGAGILAVAYVAAFKGVALQGLAAGRAGARSFDAELPSRREEALRRLLAADAHFDEQGFLLRAAAAFATVCDGWTSRDLSRARAFVSDGVYERLSREAAELAERGLRRRLTGIELRSVEALGYDSGEHFDAIYVAFRGSLVDELEATDGSAASTGGRRDLAEAWTFLRRPGAKTSGRSGPIEGRCPSCGAALEIVDAARCAACKAWVNSGEFDWVLTEVTQFAAWAFPDPERDVTGWDGLRAADPGLSLESLEDRTAVIFWRWLDARRRRDAGPLRGVAAPEFLEKFVPDGLFERDVAVEGIETTAVSRGAEFDRVHVQVSWEGERFRRRGAEESLGRDAQTFFFVLQRRRDAQSDPKAGLRTARCPSCGAAPEDSDAPACAYCGRAFNDGSRSWVLADVVPFGLWRRPDD